MIEVARDSRAPNPEAARYRKMWSFSDYRISSPGEELAMVFLAQAKPPKDAECIDFGCGTGRGSLMLALFGGLKMTMVDFADNCLDQDVRNALVTQKDRLRFVLCDMARQPIPVSAPYGYCADVMEHIAPEDVQFVLTNILGCAQHVFFSINTKPDAYSVHINEEPLHLTVQPMSWWVSELAKAGAVIHWTSAEQENGFMVYCSNWKDVADILPEGKLNTEESVIDQHVMTNVRNGWSHAQPWDRQDREVVLLGGGPSLLEQLPVIAQLREDGAALITTNGSYNWAIAQGLKPSAQIVVDAREFNSRFVKPVIPDCHYYIASQVHPKTLEGLPRDRTFLWHSCLSYEQECAIREATGNFWPTPGGSTVILRAIPLIRMLGFWRLHIFGFDSCVRHEHAVHHAYSQPENDGEPLFAVACGGKQYWCTPWMIAQASQFRALVGSLGNEVEMAVYGDGLIAQIIQTGAEMAALEEVPESAPVT